MMHVNKRTQIRDGEFRFQIIEGDVLLISYIFGRSLDIFF